MIPIWSFTKFRRTYLKKHVYTSTGNLIHGKEIKKRFHHYYRQLKSQGLNLNRCNICGQGKTWNNKPLVLELHHKNGDGYDNRISNLQILCPHCHSQTHNYKGRKS